MLSIKRIIILAIGLIGFFLTIGYYRFELDRIASINAAIAKSEAELEKKREIVRIYREKAAFYKTKEGIEHLAREQYNLVGDNERVFLLVSPDENKIFSDE
ncbi:MAG: septum formation initiator family protein [Synergistaceae bacterium]|nr:septum formation initiator family protein [Synergistaceae bacterium]MBR0094075.1 septum formation initiator family protein [Synergistaceae bacterium]